MPFYVLIIVAIVCIVVTALVTLTVRKNTVEKKVGNAEEKAREIIDDALKVADDPSAKLCWRRRKNH